jgi:hypothetical protein
MMCTEKKSSSGRRERLSIPPHLQSQRRPVPSIGLRGSFRRAGSCRRASSFCRSTAIRSSRSFSFCAFTAACWALSSSDHIASATTARTRPLLLARLLTFALLSVVCWVAAVFALQRLFGNISPHDYVRLAVLHNVKCFLESLVRPMLFIPQYDFHGGLIHSTM